MDYEKAYKEALNRAKLLKDNPEKVVIEKYKGSIHMSEYIFPELRESEDVKIKKELIDYIKSLPEKVWMGHDKEDIIAWLEKNGEQPSSQTNERVWLYLVSDVLTWKDGIGQYLDDPRVQELAKKLSSEYIQKLCNSVQDVPNEQKPVEWNEEDERIRRVIRGWIYTRPASFFDGISKEKMLAWIEKQDGKINPYSGTSFKYNNHTWGMCARDNGVEILFDGELETNKEEKVEPKFKDGDWIVYRDGVWKVCNISLQNYYELLKTNNEVGIRLIKDVDENAHLWTIDDAKDGDVLACIEEILLFKSYSAVEHRISLYCWYNGHTNNFHSKEVVDILMTTRNKICPATQEQRELLFQKMKEEGYEWDAESLTLSKIQKKWRDEEDAEVNGYYIHSDLRIVKHLGYNSIINHNVFATEKQAKSALAMARISQIMANDERFGGVVTYEEWDSAIPYFVIAKVRNMLIITHSHRYEYLGFHTMEQANLFLEENEDLVKDYYMMD